MASYNPDKSPPSPSDSSTYEDFKETLSIWAAYTSIPKEKQGMALFLTLSPTDKEAVLQIGKEKVIGAEGLQNVITRLDQLYLKDETLQKFKALEDFESFRRPSEMPINDYLIKFEKKYHTLKSYGTTMSDDLLAFRLLKSANLSVEDQKLAKGTAKLEYVPMKDQLKRLFSESTSFQQHSPTTPQSFTSVPKIEDINFTDNMNLFPR